MGWRSEVALEAWVEAVVERAGPEVVGRAAAEAAALARLHMMTLYTLPPGGVAEGGIAVRDQRVREWREHTVEVRRGKS